MKLDDFNYDLPESLIAQMPSKDRSASRLMEVSRDEVKTGRQFNEIEALLGSGDLLVLNNAKVIKARMFGQKLSGGKLEFLVERILSESQLLTQIRASKAPPVNSEVELCDGRDQAQCRFRILEKDGGFYRIELTELLEGTLKPSITVSEIVERFGHLPLPPYIKREYSESESVDDQAVFDESRYQTVYAKHEGAVAAPTAGLHFDKPLLDRLAQKGVQIGESTLYVGSGTFQPVRVENILEHQMHSETFVVTESLAEQVRETKKRGNRVIAVGTTSLRALESSCDEDGQIHAYSGDTSIFIYPGYRFKCVDVLVTNFHLPKSTLMMLVSAFVGRTRILSAYKRAVEESFRFFSYGDAMILHKCDDDLTTGEQK